ncbi:MAG: RNA 2',3'-cyclic phosphodiesterase [Candidatus Omnitrophota bacterium]|nr:RNA 2',3'-cyclic phosphodiesterase [Candidatus Omnitrophota bacterium]
MRAFIAIDLPLEIKDAFRLLQEQLKNGRPDVKWVEPKNIHLTLKFLGEISEETSTEIKKIVEEVAKENPNFQARISSAGAFPKIDFPRVIWVGVNPGGAQASKIAAQLEEKIAKLGIPPEEKRLFSPHITIGRLRSNKNTQSLISGLKNAADTLAGKNLSFLAREIIFYKSTLTPAGPAYEPLSKANLAIS